MGGIGVLTSTTGVRQGTISARRVHEPLVVAFSPMQQRIPASDQLPSVNSLVDLVDVLLPSAVFVARLLQPPRTGVERLR